MTNANAVSAAATDFSSLDRLEQAGLLALIGMAAALQFSIREPRIHVALVCAAVSCPKLRSEPYEGGKLNAQLDDQVRGFLSDPRHFRIDQKNHKVRVSEIFRWYAEDFAPSGAAPKDKAAQERSALVNFASAYLSKDEQVFLRNAAIEYAPYDWSLNEQPR